MNYNTIGYFQFDNLMKGRVPLALILLDDIDFSSWYNSMVKMHLEVITHRLESVEEVLPLIQEKKIDRQFGILILDQTGQKSRAAVEKLEAAGYMNAFFVERGFEQILTEKEQN